MKLSPIFRVFFWCFLFFSGSLYANQAAMLLSTESDPDSFIENCINVINGDYCESATDLIVQGPDNLILQRYYNAKDYVWSRQTGGWRIFPQRFLVMGTAFGDTQVDKEGELLEGVRAFVGERSGGILTYSGWRKQNGLTKNPLQIEGQHAIGMVNTYAQEISGKNNHLNNRLHCRENDYLVILGDGTKRFYSRMEKVPTAILGEELLPMFANRIDEPDYFHLIEEQLPSGNTVFFSYDEEGHLAGIELKNTTNTKILSWMRFSYQFVENQCDVIITTSDEKTLHYHFVDGQLTDVQGSHLIPCSYEYQKKDQFSLLIRKSLPERQFIEIDYDDQRRVKSFKRPDPSSEESTIAYTFCYKENETEVRNAYNCQTSYHFNKQKRLVEIKHYDGQGELYRIDQKFWGKSGDKGGLLTVKAILDGKNQILSHRSFSYDEQGNVVKEILNGNLTGEKVSLFMHPDGQCTSTNLENRHSKIFEYSTDGYNLLTHMEDSKGNSIDYHYESNTNRLTQKFIREKDIIKRRAFYAYNEDAVCIKIIDDDGFYPREFIGSYERPINEKSIISIKPKEFLPGVGLPEIVEERILNEQGEEVLTKKEINLYDAQGNLLNYTLCDHLENPISHEEKTYNYLGQILSKIDHQNKGIYYTYDACGHLKSTYEGDQLTTYHYNACGQLIQTIEMMGDLTFTSSNTYDLLGRQITSTDGFGHTTHYAYDDLGRLTQVIHPEVLDENGRPIRPTFSYTYDLMGYATSVTDPKGHTTRKLYNLCGQPTKIFYPDGSTEYFKYDAEGSLHRSKDKNGLITVYEYDHFGRMTHSETTVIAENGDTYFFARCFHEYEGSQCVLDKYSRLLHRHKYDKRGRVIETVEQKDPRYEIGDSLEKIWKQIKLTDEIDSESHQVQLTYDASNRVIRKKIWFGTGSEEYACECFEYDLFDHIIEKRIEDSQGNILLRKGFVYDHKGQCTEEFSYQEGKRVTLVKIDYNALGEPIRFEDALGHETKVVIDYAYQNGLSQRVVKKTLIDPLGIQTEMEFDTLGRLVLLVKKDFLGELLSSQKITYDAVGNKTSEMHLQISEGEVIGSKTMRWSFGPMGRVEEEYEGDQKRISYCYEEKGKLVKAQFSSGFSINYEYNLLGRVKRIYGGGERDNHLVDNSYAYDQRGNVIKAISREGLQVERTYNIFDQVTEEVVSDECGAYATQYTYDRRGRLTSLALPDSSKIVYRYDALYGKSVTRLSPQGEVLYTHTYDRYDEQGKLLAETLIGQLGSREHQYELGSYQKSSSRSDFFNEDYAHDILGKVLEIKRKASFPVADATFIYNDRSQLTSEKIQDIKTYECDSLDQRLKLNNQPYIYTDSHQLIAHRHANFSYDMQGNVRHKELNEQKTRFESNVLCQLVAMKKADESRYQFAYDAFGRLMTQKYYLSSESEDSIISRFLYVGYQEIGALNEKSEIEALRVPGLNGDQLSLKSVAMEREGKVFAPLHDLSGNVVALLNPSNRQVVESYQYSAFGEESIYNASGEKIEHSNNPWRFAEKRKIDQWILFGFRFYDPLTGRWLSQDPMGFAEGPNLYAYLHHNPLSYVDRFGLEAEEAAPDMFDFYFYGQYECQCECEVHRTCKRGGDINRSADLPKVTYRDDFENYRLKRSRLYSLDLPEISKDLGIGFINGICNSFDESKANAEHISKLAGGYNVHTVYNATNGLLTDLYECRMGLDFIATPPVRLLHQMWNRFFDNASADAKFLMVCHSQGAIHTRNALLSYNPELADRIIVLAIAPAAYMYKETCAQVIHYRAHTWRDPIPRVDQVGSRRVKDTVITLDSHPESPRHDHNFMSPTYTDELFRKIIIYIRSGGKEI